MTVAELSMTDQIYQMNVTYVAREDRLLLRVSTRQGAEYRIWLTRRFTDLLVGILQRCMDRFGGAPSLAASREARSLFKQGAMEKSFDDGKAVEFPLGTEGVLACKVNSRALGGEGLALQILPEQGQGMTLNLNKTLLYMFFNVLTQGVEQAGWYLKAGEAPAHVH